MNKPMDLLVIESKAVTIVWDFSAEDVTLVDAATSISVTYDQLEDFVLEAMMMRRRNDNDAEVMARQACRHCGRAARTAGDMHLAEPLYWCDVRKKSSCSLLPYMCEKAGCTTFIHAWLNHEWLCFHHYKEVRQKNADLKAKALRRGDLPVVSLRPVAS